MIYRKLTNCKFTATVRHTNRAHSLDGYLWAISSLATEKLQIHCLHHTSVITIESPLHIVDIGNGCEAFSPTLYIPVKSELTTTMQSLTRSQFLQYNLQYVEMSFVIFCEMTFEHLTPEELTDLHAKVQTLEPMNMKLFNEKLRLIDENYPLTIPPWVTLGGQVISGAFILTEMTLMAWFCLKHRKSVNTLLKLGLSFARKLKDNPRIIEQLTQRATDLVANITPPEPPPRVHIAAADSPTLASKWNRNDSPVIAPLTSIAVPPSSSGAHRRTLEFITEAAQELYAKGQLFIKPYAGYLKGKRVQSRTHDSPLRTTLNILLPCTSTLVTLALLQVITLTLSPVWLLTFQQKFIVFLRTLFKLPMTMAFNSVDTLLADFVQMDTSEFL